ncbi:MAG TPA: hypothetical protein VMT03_22085 [Polyangia bacterium]|nr:hypothetical protein [Polyangia bacterium]
MREGGASHSYLEPLAVEVESVSRNGVPTCVHVNPNTLELHPEIARFAKAMRLAVYPDEDMQAGAFRVCWEYLN